MEALRFEVAHYEAKHPIKSSALDHDLGGMYEVQAVAESILLYSQNVHQMTLDLSPNFPI